MGFSKMLPYLTTNDGLSQNEVTAILKDQKGFLWIGTRGGLNRFDGSKFKIFQPESGNKNSMISSSVESLFEDGKGKIWIGTKSNGLSKYDPVLNKFTHYSRLYTEENNTIGERIISITEGKCW